MFLPAPPPSLSGTGDDACDVVEHVVMGEFSIWHWLIVIVIVLLLFGRGKVTDLMGDVAQGIKAFKKGMSEDDKAEATPSEPAKAIDHAEPAEAPPKDAVRHSESTHT